MAAFTLPTITYIDGTTPVAGSHITINNMIQTLNSPANDVEAGLVQIAGTTELDTNVDTHVVTPKGLMDKLTALNYAIAPSVANGTDVGTVAEPFDTMHVTNIMLNGIPLLNVGDPGAGVVTLNDVQTITAYKTFSNGLNATSIECSEFSGTNVKYTSNHNIFGTGASNDVAGNATHLTRFKQVANTTPFVDNTLATTVDWTVATPAVYLPRTLSGNIIPIELTTVVTLCPVASASDTGIVFEIPLVVNGGAVATITPSGGTPVLFNGASYTSLVLTNCSSVKVTSIRLVSTSTYAWVVLASSGAVTGI